MRPEVKEKLDYSIKLAYELLERVDAGEQIKAMSFIQRHAEKIVGPLNECIQSVINEPNYRNAISTLQTEFRHVESAQNILEDVYRKCPSLRPKAPSLNPESVT